MMVEGQVHALDIRQVGGDVAIRNQDGAILHVLGVDELDVVDHVQFLEQDRTHQPVEIAAGDQAEILIAHGTCPLKSCAPVSCSSWWSCSSWCGTSMPNIQPASHTRSAAVFKYNLARVGAGWDEIADMVNPPTASGQDRNPVP